MKIDEKKIFTLASNIDRREDQIQYVLGLVRFYSSRLTQISAERKTQEEEENIIVRHRRKNISHLFGKKENQWNSTSVLFLTEQTMTIDVRLFLRFLFLSDQQRILLLLLRYEIDRSDSINKQRQCIISSDRIVNHPVVFFSDICIELDDYSRPIRIRRSLEKIPRFSLQMKIFSTIFKLVWYSTPSMLWQRVESSQISTRNGQRKMKTFDEEK